MSDDVPTYNINNKTEKELFIPTLYSNGKEIESKLIPKILTQQIHQWLPIKYNWLDWSLLFDINNLL